MPQQYTNKQFWKLYKNLPQELKDALFDEEMGDNIYEICRSNNVGNHLEEIVELVGQVLMGLLPPEDFPEVLEELKIKKDVAKKIARGINRFAFYPVRPALEQLYQIPKIDGGQTITQPTIIETMNPKNKSKRPVSNPDREDPYREIIEEENE